MNQTVSEACICCMGGEAEICDNSFISEIHSDTCFLTTKVRVPRAAPRWRLPSVVIFKFESINIAIASA